MSPDPAPSPTDNPVLAELPDPGAGVPPGNDPGGARGKGYGPDSGPDEAPLPDPIPLAADAPPGIHVPEREAGVHLLGPADPGPGGEVSGP